MIPTRKAAALGTASREAKDAKCKLDKFGEERRLFVKDGSLDQG